MAKLLGSTLFPILNSDRAPNQGIARLAAAARHSDDGHRIEFKTLDVRSVLNKSVSKRKLWLAYSINPYRGCEFACRYCYARYTHEFLVPSHKSRDPEALAASHDAFEHQIYLKQNAAWLLEQELARIDRTQEIALGTATDPYQPIERRARITRSILEVFARKSGYRIGIVTKSRLITRDVELLQQIAQKNALVIHLTITTPDPDLARILEPRAPRPDLRLAAVQKLRQAGLTAGILCSPLLPGITDSEAALDRMAARAAEVDASFFAAQPLFLKPCSHPTFLRFIREHFPRLEADYTARFATDAFARPAYNEEISKRVRTVRERHKLAGRSFDALLTRIDDSYTAGPRAESPRKLPYAVPTGYVQGKLFA